MEDVCEIKDDVVRPCRTLSSNIDSTNGRRKGVSEWVYVNMKTSKLTRSYIGVKSDQNPKGMIFNHCPFCGVRIAPEE